LCGPSDRIWVLMVPPDLGARRVVAAERPPGCRPAGAAPAPAGRSASLSLASRPFFLPLGSVLVLHTEQ